MEKIILVLFILSLNISCFAQYGFKAPVNKIDSIDINLRYTKLCINEYRKQVNDSYFYYLTGFSLAGLGYGVNFKFKNEESGFTNINYILMGTGGVFFIVGIINYFDANKWLKRAGIEPVLTPNGAYVYINF